MEEDFFCVFPRVRCFSSSPSSYSTASSRRHDGLRVRRTRTVSHSACLAPYDQVDGQDSKERISRGRESASSWHRHFSDDEDSDGNLLEPVGEEQESEATNSSRLVWHQPVHHPDFVTDPLNECHALARRLSRAEEKLTEKSLLLETMYEADDQRKEELASLRRERSANRAQIQNMQTKLEALSIDIAQLEDEKEALKHQLRECRESESEFRSRSQEAAQLESELQKAAANISRFVAEAAASHAVAKSLEGECRSRDQAIRCLKRKIGRLKLAVWRRRSSSCRTLSLRSGRDWLWSSRLTNPVAILTRNVTSQMDIVERRSSLAASETSASSSSSSFEAPYRSISSMRPRYDSLAELEPLTAERPLTDSLHYELQLATMQESEESERMMAAAQLPERARTCSTQATLPDVSVASKAQDACPSAASLFPAGGIAWGPSERRRFVLVVVVLVVPIAIVFVRASKWRTNSSSASCSNLLLPPDSPVSYDKSDTTRSNELTTTVSLPAHFGWVPTSAWKQRIVAWFWTLGCCVLCSSFLPYF